MSDNENKPLNLNITFKYDYFDKKLQKEVKYDYTILKNGEFLHSAIRNQNFYDNIIDKYAELSRDEKTGQQSHDQIKPAIREADKSDNIIKLAIPFSNKYIDLNILDKIIINEGKDKSKNEKLKFDDFVKELKNTDNSYNITNYEDFIGDIFDLFNKDRDKRVKAKEEVNEKIKKINSKKQNISYNELIKKL